MIAKGAIVLLSIASIMMLLFLCYVGYLIVSDSKEYLREGRSFARVGFVLKKSGWAGPLLLLLIITFLGVAYIQTEPNSDLTRLLTTLGMSRGSASILSGAMTLFLAMATCSVFYFALLRRKWTDDRVRYVLLLWSGLWLLTGLALVLVWRAHDVLVFEIGKVDSQSFAQYIATLAQLAGIIIAATMVIVTNRHNAKEADDTSRQRIYQTLELESVKLFRFECDHKDLVAMLWFSDGKNFAEARALAQGGQLSDAEKSRGLSLVDFFRLKEYIFQILNLFEMACRFCRQDIVDADIFGSWVIWMWHISQLKTFQSLWPGEHGMEFNYVADLRDIMNAGIYFSTEAPIESGAEERKSRVTENDRLHSFYNFVADRMFDVDEQTQRELVRNWLEPSPEEKPKYQKYWVISNSH